MADKQNMPSEKPISAKSQSTDPARLWSVRRRLIVSVLLTLHLTAVVAAPMASPPPASDLSQQIARWFEPYLFAAFLNHGYRFFAPNPGPSHLVRYELDMADGTTITGRFPNLDEHWPRLFYHRYLMISETVFNLADVPDDDPQALRQQIDRLLGAAQRLDELGFGQEAQGYKLEAAELQSRLDGRISPTRQRTLELANRQKETLLTGIAEDLLRRHKAVRVRLYGQVHNIPDLDDVLSGRPLDDPDLYVEQLLGEFTGDEL